MIVRMFRIPAPTWAKAYSETRSDEFDHADYECLKSLQVEIDRETGLAIQRYIDEEPDDELFPDRNRLTGEFYIGSGSYLCLHQDWFAKVGRQRELNFSFLARCLEKASGVQVDRDYLGLEVHFRWYPEQGAFEWVATDSSCI